MSSSSRRNVGRRGRRGQNLPNLARTSLKEKRLHTTRVRHSCDTRRAVLRVACGVSLWKAGRKEGRKRGRKAARKEGTKAGKNEGRKEGRIESLLGEVKKNQIERLLREREKNQIERLFGGEKECGLRCWLEEKKKGTRLKGGWGEKILKGTKRDSSLKGLLV